MQPLESSLRRGSSHTSTDIDQEALGLPRGGDGRPKIPITRHLDDSGRTKSTTATEDKLPQIAYTFESVEEKRPIRNVTWNIVKKEEEEEQEETLSMLGRRKLKAWKEQELAKKKEEERKSWKTWFWSQGCPCMEWSPMHLFRCDEDRSTVAAYDQSTVATKSFDQSSVATRSTFVTLDDGDGDDTSTIPSFSRVGHSLDESTIEDDDNISDVSSNSTDATLDWEIEDGLEMLAQQQQPPKLSEISPPFKPKLSATTVEADIVKDWSREGLSLNTIDDMDLYMEAMRS